MTSIRTRTTIIAALASLGLTSALPAASQARAHHASLKRGATHTITVTKTPTTTMLAIRKSGPLGPIVHVNLPAVKSALTAGGAGIPGYGDSQCESLAGDYNKAVSELDAGVLEGNEDRASKYGNIAERIYGQMSDNCLVVY
jgi:hypothetical protein